MIIVSQQVFAVDGLHCKSCVATVTEALGALPTVDGVTVELGSGEPSRVYVTAGRVLTHGEIQAALDDEGDYTVRRDPE